MDPALGFPCATSYWTCGSVCWEHSGKGRELGVGYVFVSWSHIGVPACSSPCLLRVCGACQDVARAWTCVHSPG